MNYKIGTVMFLVILLKTNVRGHLNLDWDPPNSAFDPNIYEEALDAELCQEQLAHIRRLSNILLRLQFLGAGMRFPRGILTGNSVDMGNYLQCLGIEQETDSSTIEGKYCMVTPRFGSNEDLESFAASLNSEEFEEGFSESILKKQEEINRMKSHVMTGEMALLRNRTAVAPVAELFALAVCVPKTCTSEEGIRGLQLNLNLLNIRFEEQFCRFKNDKPWVAADYVTISIFSIIGLLTLFSTSYDVWHQIVAKKDPKTASTLYRSFSLYTNTRRLLTFSSSPGTLECVDGIRTIAMIWVIVGHVYTTFPQMVNFLDAVDWAMSFRSLWITAAPYTVDTFFMLTGILVVYTTAGKMSSMKLLKSLHLFYLNRILRMFPLLAAAILLQASILHRIADGPMWNAVAQYTDDCRTYWWTTLLYVQNFVNPKRMCIVHSWYLAIDMHLYLISPFILYWVLTGKKTAAWIALTAGLLASLTAGTTYSFINNFSGWIGVTMDDEMVNYMIYFYFNTLTRASPFFVGTLYGYLLHIYKGKKLDMPAFLVLFLWACAITITSLAMYVTHLMKDFLKWDNQLVNNLVNSFARPMWAMAVGWIVFACHTGYGGPANWVLSLRVWKLPSRLSYGMYLFHYPILFAAVGRTLQPIYFVEADMFFESIKHLAISFGVSFVLTVFIDSPISILIKMLFGDGPKRPKKEVEDKE